MLFRSTPNDRLSLRANQLRLSHAVNSDLMSDVIADAGERLRTSTRRPRLALSQQHFFSSSPPQPLLSLSSGGFFFGPRARPPAIGLSWANAAMPRWLHPPLPREPLPALDRSHRRNDDGSERGQAPQIAHGGRSAAERRCPQSGRPDRGFFEKGFKQVTGRTTKARVKC
jgi:hypothetical protein